MKQQLNAQGSPVATAIVIGAFGVIIVLALLLYAVPANTDQPQELPAEWQEISSPPGIAGPCWAYLVNHKIEGVYCSEAGPTEEEMQKMFELGRGG